MNLARLTLAAAVLALGVTATQGRASATALDHLHPKVAGAWMAGTIPANGPPSPVPGVAEWSSAREVDVTKSTAYHCETKVIREWFRSSCVAYGKWTLLAPTCKQSNGDPCFTWNDPAGSKASIVQRLRRGFNYQLVFAWAPGGAPYTLSINVDQAGGATAGF